MKKIHFLSDSLKINSGFAIVSRHLSTGLKKLGYEVSMTGIQTSYAPDYHYGILQYPLATDIPENIQFVTNLMTTQPDAVLYVGDMYTDISYLSKIPLDLKIPIIVYCPVEGYRIPKRMVKDLIEISNGGKVVAQCQYGFNEMKRCGINVDRYIYHGFDPNIFYPNKNLIIHKNIENNIEETLTLTKYLNNQWTEIIDLPISQFKNQFNKKFVYLFVGANLATRKRIEKLLDAYRLLINESRLLKDKTQLHLHTVPKNLVGIDLFDIINEFNIQDNVSFSYKGVRGTELSDNAMNIIFNSSDCFVSASSSEGFSLAHINAIACGIPCISPDCTSMTELIGNDKDQSKNRGYLVKINDEYMMQDLSVRFLVDRKDLASKMKEIYSNRDLIKKFSENCAKWSRSYTWDKIVSQWDDLIKTI